MSKFLLFSAFQHRYAIQSRLTWPWINNLKKHWLYNTLCRFQHKRAFKGEKIKVMLIVKKLKYFFLFCLAPKSTPSLPTASSSCLTTRDASTPCWDSLSLSKLLIVFLLSYDVFLVSYDVLLVSHDVFTISWSIFISNDVHVCHQFLQYFIL